MWDKRKNISRALKENRKKEENTKDSIECAKNNIFDCSDSFESAFKNLHFLLRIILRDLPSLNSHPENLIACYRDLINSQRWKFRELVWIYIATTTNVVNPTWWRGGIHRLQLQTFLLPFQQDTAKFLVQKCTSHCRVPGHLERNNFIIIRRVHVSTV